MIDYSEKHERDAKWMPTPEQIAAECKAIRAENDAKQRQGKAYQPPVDDDCDAALEDEADRECR
jgi:hypothetical protein